MKVALIAFVNEQGDILLNKRRHSTDEELWDLIGGGIEEGETPLDAIVRELKEELSYMIDVTHLKPLGTYRIETEKYQAEVSFFVAAAPNLDELTSSEETFVEDLLFMTPDIAQTKHLLPMARLFFDKNLLNI